MTFIKVIKNDGFVITLCDLGASVYEISLNEVILTMTPKYKKDFAKTSVYNGKTIGRVTNRIKDATIKVDSITYHLDANDGNNTLHGGRNGLSTKFFDYEFSETDLYLLVNFKYSSPHLEAGFPGTVLFSISYLFPKSTDDFFGIYLRASSNEKTPINLTNHLYFTLGESSNKFLNVFMPSKSYFDVDENHLPTKLIPHKELCFTTRFGLNSKDYLDKFSLNEVYTFDNYVFKDFKNINYDKPDVIISSPSIILSIHSTFPGAQIYSDSQGDDIIYKNTKLKSNRSIAVEPSYPTNQLYFIDKDNDFNADIFYSFQSKILHKR